MKKFLLRLVIIGLVVTQVACLDLLNGIVGGSTDGSASGSGSNDPSNDIGGSGNQIISVDSDDADVGSGSGDTNYSNDYEGVDIPVGIAKLERGEMDATQLYGTVTTVTSSNATASSDSSGSSDPVSVDMLQIDGTSDAVTGECADGEDSCVADIVVIDEDTDHVLRRLQSNTDGSFAFRLASRFIGKDLKLALLDPETGREDYTLSMKVFSSNHFAVRLSNIPAQQTKIGIDDGMLIYNERDVENFYNNVVIQNQKGGDKTVMIEDVAVINNISRQAAGLRFGESRGMYFLGLSPDGNTVMFSPGDEDLTTLNDVPNHTLNPSTGLLKSISHIEYTTQPRGEFVAQSGRNDIGEGVSHIELIPTFDSDIANDILIQSGLLGSVRNRSMVFMNDSSLLVMDGLNTENYQAKVLDLAALVSKTPVQLEQFRRDHPTPITVPTQILFSTTVPISDPLMSKLEPGSERFIVFRCKPDGNLQWGICLNFFDNEIIDLSAELEGETVHMDINSNNDFIASAQAMANGNALISLTHIATGDVIMVTPDISDTTLTYIQPTFSDIDPYTLIFLQQTPKGQLDPSVINLKLLPQAGRYIPTSRYCDNTLVDCI